MGMCNSRQATSVATVKLIHEDGRLQEFQYPVKVSYILQKYPAYFICNSDEMEFGNVLSAVSDDDELQLCQLYFALPLSRLKRRLQAEDMAALALKASSALRNRGNIMFLPGKNGVKMSRTVPGGGKIGGSGSRQRRKRSFAGRSGRFMASLSAIPE